ncbi:MAG: exonuclease SbcCD subunit D [Actinomycetota bacterium]|nr:exonuclease SbcCD subunit D [Actinomycetota bacterium]
MRILHTADWHLGREFHGADLGEAHEAFFDWLATQITEREVDLVLMAGDIFDRAVPPTAAVELLNRTLSRLADLAPTILIAGNHDSTVRMGHGQLLRDNLHLRSGTTGVGEPVLFEAGHFAGAGFSLAVYPIPYLDPVASAEKLGAPEKTHQSVLDAATAICRDDLAERPEGTRSIVISHAFVAGGAISDSERGIAVGRTLDGVVGGAGQVGAGTFDGFDYVALGHLHRPQRMDSQEEVPRVRYSGSPLYLSFSEVGADKSVNLVELAADGSITVDPVTIPSSFRVSRVRAELAELLEDDRYLEYADDWLEVTLTDRKRPDRPMDRLASRFSRVLSLQYSDLDREAPGAEARRLAGIMRKDPLALVSEFVEHVRGEGPDEDETALLREAVSSNAGSETSA